MPWVYLLTNLTHTTLYVGVTSNLAQRLEQHRTGETDSFSRRYHVDKLVYLEEHPSIQDAIAREKTLKGYARRHKLRLIATQNPNWQDLAKLL